MQQDKNSQNSHQMASDADGCQDFASRLGLLYDFLVRIMVSLCVLFWHLFAILGQFSGNYLSFFSSHNGMEQYG